MPAGQDLVPSPYCQALCGSALRREFSDPEYFAVHQLTVAAYQAQHPDGLKPFGLAVHLSVLCLHAEQDLPIERMRRPLRRVSERLRAQPPADLPAPAARGRLGVADVARAEDAAEHGDLVRAWATEQWATWAAVHDRVRGWISAASTP